MKILTKLKGQASVARDRETIDSELRLIGRGVMVNPRARTAADELTSQRCCAAGQGHKPSDLAMITFNIILALVPENCVGYSINPLLRLLGALIAGRCPKFCCGRSADGPGRRRDGADPAADTGPTVMADTDKDAGAENPRHTSGV